MEFSTYSETWHAAHVTEIVPRIEMIGEWLKGTGVWHGVRSVGAEHRIIWHVVRDARPHPHLMIKSD